MISLNDRVHQHLTRVRLHSHRLRRTHLALVWSSLVAGSLATLLAGATTANGQSFVGQGNAGWILTCGLVAVLTLVATVATGIMQQLRVAERMAQAQSYTARLAALDLALALPRSDADALAQEYTALLREYPEINEA